ncbi:hypothetical protein FQN49_004680 [Arthroderma sp. PD_2]|nr:hypothetical protein FQN49_004680 [Arthroderma sp. PD_2]
MTAQSSDEWTSTLESEKSDESEEVDTPQHAKIKKDIEEALRSIDSKGDFASFHSLNRELNPSLHINGLGRVVNLPLSPEDAKAIVDLCHRSPFGKGTETLVDTSVRKCWELDTAEFDIKAPGWGNYMKKIVADVSKGLGVADKANSIRVDPYKLLLYEEGAFFLSHQDSPKADGMFATLIVCLPTKHEGGEIVLKHDNRSLFFESSTTSSAGFSYAAWYSDVFHEIQPITAGHRLVLTYNLILDGASSVPTAPTSKTTPLSNAMQRWKSRVEEDGLDYLLYKLSHMYTDSSLSFQKMKGKDSQRMIELQAACQALDFNLYLGNVERRVYGGCDDYPGDNGYYEIDELCDDESSLQKVVDAEGNLVTTKMPIEPLDFVQRRVLRGEPTEEDYSGYTGNEGTSVTHFYRKTVAIIVPKSLDVDFRFRGMLPRNEADLSTWLKRLLPLISDQEDSTSREEFSRVAKLTLNHNEVYNKFKEIRTPWSQTGHFRDKFSDTIISLVAQGLYMIKDLKTFEESIQLHSEFVGPVLHPFIAENLASREYPVVKKVLEAILAKTEQKPSKKAITVDGLVSACLALPDDKRPAEWEDLANWRKQNLLTILPSFHSSDKSDGACLVRIVELYPEKDILEKTMESRRWGRVSGVTASYLAQLGDSFTSGRLAIDGFPAFYQSALADLMVDFDLGQGAALEYDMSSRPLAKRLQFQPSAIDGGDLIKIYRHCQSLDISPAALYCGILKSLKDCQVLNLAFTEILVPFLQDIVSNPLDPLEGEGKSPEARFVFRLLLEYVLIYVEPRAQAATSWKRPAKSGCGCKDCDTLNNFLQNPGQKSARFPMSKPRRYHIHTQLNRDSTISHETERYGSPYTMVVTKIGNPATMWKARAVKAVKNIKRVGSAAQMEAFIGSSAYKSLQDLDIVVKGGSVSDYVGVEDIGGRKRAATSELNRTDTPGGQNGPRGQEVEMIDLT